MVASLALSDTLGVDLGSTHTVAAIAEPPSEPMTDDVVHPDVNVGFAVKSPAPGQYVLQVVDAHGGQQSSAANAREVPFPSRSPRVPVRWKAAGAVDVLSP